MDNPGLFVDEMINMICLQVLTQRKSFRRPMDLRDNLDLYTVQRISEEYMGVYGFNIELLDEVVDRVMWDCMEQIIEHEKG